jgi:transposase
MSRFKVYSPEQAYLPPPSVRDELGSGHLCYFVRGVIERLDMSVFEQSYAAEGGELYAPELMLGVWLYVYALGITSARQVERRLVEDLAFRYLAGGEKLNLGTPLHRGQRRSHADTSGPHSFWELYRHE